MVANKKLNRLALALVSSAAVFAAPSMAFDLTGKGFVQYGDAQSYSLPILGLQAGCDKPGCEFYVNSTPGAIKGLTVLGTGSNGSDVVTNFAGMDNAYQTPTGVITSNPFWRPDPTNSRGTQIGAGIYNGDFTWDTTLGALKSYLTTGSVIEQMIFFFNNNQTKSLGTQAESLAAWAQITIRDAAGAVIGIYDFTNRNLAYTSIGDGGSGGVLNGNVTTYTHLPANTATNPIAGTAARTDYVLSGGAICLDATATPISCTADPSKVVVGPIDHNLGANQAAYAILFPELNAQLLSLFSSLSATNLGLYTMNVDMRLGCDPSLGPTASTELICTGGGNLYGRDLNNGFEQIFISKGSDVVNVVPEPGTLVLAGLALLGLGVASRRKS